MVSEAGVVYHSDAAVDEGEESGGVIQSGAHSLAEGLHGPHVVRGAELRHAQQRRQQWREHQLKRIWEGVKAPLGLGARDRDELAK